MKLTRKQLDELIRYITKSVLKEWSSLSGNDNDSDPGTPDDGVKPDDAKTAYEKSKAEREARKKQQDTIRSATLDLKSTKKQQDYFSQQAKKNKVDIQAKEKQLQSLKGASPSTTMVPAGGVIAK
jgi:hypothetical protein